MKNRQAVAPSEAWHEFWNVLSPDDPDFEATLHKWVKANLCAFSFPEYWTELTQPAEWANSVEISCKPEGLFVSVGGHAFRPALWFISNGPLELPTSEFNALERLVNRTDANAATIKYWREHARILIVAVAALTGNRIMRLFKQAISKGHLKATAPVNPSLFKTKRRAGKTTRRAVSTPDHSLSKSWVPAGPLDRIEISIGPNFAPKKISYNFDDEDDRIADEIEALVIRENLNSKAATRRLAHKISTMPGAKPASGFDRVYRCHLRKYGKKTKARPAKYSRSRA